MQIAVFAKECHARANMRLFSTITCAIADENGLGDITGTKPGINAFITPLFLSVKR